jgi:hypothetical protein
VFIYLFTNLYIICTYFTIVLSIIYILTNLRDIDLFPLPLSIYYLLKYLFLLNENCVYYFFYFCSIYIFSFIFRILFAYLHVYSYISFCFSRFLVYI